MQGVETWLTVDTGASKTIVSKGLYDQMDKKPDLNQNRHLPLSQASGSQLLDMGMVNLKFSIGDVNFEKEVVVADIQDNVLIGLDIGDPFDVITSEKHVFIQGQRIPCVAIRSSVIRKVWASDEFLIHAQCEMIVDAQVENDESDSLGEMLIEASPTFGEHCGLIMAASLVDLSRSVSTHVHIMNLSDKPVTLHEDSVIGYAEEVDPSTRAVVYQETETQDTDLNMSATRQVKCDNPHPVDKTYQADSQPSNTQLTHQSDLVDQLSEHMKSIFLKTTASRTDIDEQQEIFRFCQTFQSSFSCTENDISLTNLTEHAINTGDARPLRQRPRRVPSALAADEKQAIQTLLHQGVIVESASPWVSPIVLVKKEKWKNQTLCRLPTTQ